MKSEGVHGPESPPIFFLRSALFFSHVGIVNARIVCYNF